LDGLLGAGGGIGASKSGSSDLILADAFLGDRDLRMLAGGGGGGGARSSCSSKGLLLLLTESASNMPLLERFARALAASIFLDCGTI
jgi:hypothetical protein